MIRLYPLAMMVLLAFAGITGTTNPAVAEIGAKNFLFSQQQCSQQQRGFPVVAIAEFGNSCPRASRMASMSYPPVLEVSCASSEWCCKHDIGGTGQCTRCCPK